jgi:hypothetical protein
MRDGNLIVLNPTFDLLLPSTDGLFTENGLSAINDFKDATGISENSFSNTVNIYPNPTSGKFHISGCMPGSTVYITDMQGQLIIEKIITGGDDQEMSLEDCQPGVYMISVNQQNKNSFYKLILQ